jgi:F-type H+-transporting ATPase subunit b
MLIYLANIIILVVALYFLLYKPVSKIIAAHRQKLKDVFDENQRLNAEAAETKRKYEALIDDVKQEVARIGADAAAKAQVKADEVIGRATEQADNIIRNAKQEAFSERERLKNELYDSVGRIAVDIAQKVLEREVSVDDNRRLIDSYLTEWES